jgi:rod shape determining protein RodA
MKSISLIHKFFKDHRIFLKREFFKFDKFLLINSLIIFLIGCAEIFSSTANNDEHFFLKQFLLGSLCFAVFFSAVPALKQIVIIKYSYVLYFISVTLLVLVMVAGDRSMGATRWVNILGFRIQPSEIMKISLILALSRYFFFQRLGKNSIIKYIIPIAMIAIPAGLIFLQPDLGTAVLILIIGFGIIFAYGISYVYIGIVAIIALVSLPIVWSNMHDYQKKRVTVFLDPSLDPFGSGYNIIQSKVSIGSGGLIGNGYMQGKQSQLNFLPENHTDFIFTHFSEEFGFVGTITLLSLYMCLFIRIGYAALNVKSYFGRIASVGILLDVASHVFVNIGMTTGMLPVVGIPLPFMSYGGTFLVVNIFKMALVNNFIVNKYKHVPTSEKFL